VQPIYTRMMDEVRVLRPAESFENIKIVRRTTVTWLTVMAFEARVFVITLYYPSFSIRISIYLY